MQNNALFEKANAYKQALQHQSMVGVGRTERALAIDFASVADIGRRESQQDALSATEVKARDGQTRLFLLGVYDGHGEKGEWTSNIVKNALETHVYDADNLVDSLRAAIANADDLLIRQNELIAVENGTTCCVALINLDTAVCCVANVGDSRLAVYSLASADFHPIMQTNDHSWGNPSENRRIFKLIKNRQEKTKANDCRVSRKSIGGSNKHVYIYRSQNTDGTGHAEGVNMTRALGHILLRDCGIIPEPEITQLQLQPGYSIVVASDGCWDKITAFDIGLMLTTQKSAAESSQRILAKAKPLHDNTSIAVAYFSRDPSATAAASSSAPVQSSISSCVDDSTFCDMTLKARAMNYYQHCFLYGG